ncbi:MAG TPA: hypothetical protein VGF92_05450 [Stellaceae bacterium]|jgi:hypothetical protein
MTVEIGRNVTNFANGSSVVAVTTATLPDETKPVSQDNAPSAVATAYTITAGPDGAMPPGYPDAFPGATVSDNDQTG